MLSPWCSWQIMNHLPVHTKSRANSSAMCHIPSRHRLNVKCACPFVGKAYVEISCVHQLIRELMVGKDGRNICKKNSLNALLIQSGDRRADTMSWTRGERRDREWGTESDSLGGQMDINTEVSSEVRRGHGHVLVLHSGHYQQRHHIAVI